MTIFTTKKNEWSQNALETDDLKKQVCRPIDNKNWKELVADISCKLDLTPGLNSILDVGCGNALLLSQLTPEIENYYGTDYADSMISQAKHQISNGQFSVGEAAELNFTDKQFDRVLSYSIFHYFPDESYINKAIEEFIRVTKPGGIILIGDLLDKQFEQTIKDASDLEYEKQLPYIMRYSEWTFCDLNKVKAQLEKNNKVTKVEILKQPKNFQLSHYRKDLKIWL